MMDRENVALVEAATARLRKHLPQSALWTTDYAASLFKRALEVAGLTTSLAVEMLGERLPSEVSDGIKKTADLVVNSEDSFVGYAQLIKQAQDKKQDPVVLPLFRQNLLALLDTISIAWRAIWDIWDERPFITKAQLKNLRIFEISQEMLAAGERLAAIAPKQPYGPPDVSPPIVTAPRSRAGGVLLGLAAVGIVGAVGVALWRR